MKRYFLTVLAVSIFLLALGMPSLAVAPGAQYRPYIVTLNQGSQMLKGPADTTSAANIRTLRCSDWPGQRWGLLSRFYTYAGKDSADSMHTEARFKYTGQTSWGNWRLWETLVPASARLHDTLVTPPAKPESLQVRDVLFDANTCSTRVWHQIICQ
jgi:hypothetical protein